MSAVADDYKQLEIPESSTMELCPCCGGKPELWQYTATPGGPTTKVVMCATVEPIGPQDGLTNEGCPLYMPPDCHYRATIREAVTFWNDFAKALTALQRKNRWAEHSALRQEGEQS
jgi:hypothetical protein